MSDQDNGMVTTLQRPITDDQEAWRAYWEAKGWPWRTEPEIDAERQKYLAERRAIVPDIEKGIYPFKDIKLSRADIEWLVAIHRDRYKGVNSSECKGIDFRGTDFHKMNLSYLPFMNILGGLNWYECSKATDEQIEMASVHWEGANLNGVNIEKAYLRNAHLEDTDLRDAYLAQADLKMAHLEGVRLHRTCLERTQLIGAYLEGSDLYKANFEEADLSNAHLEGSKLLKTCLKRADLRNVHLEGTGLREAHLEGTFLGNAYLNGKKMDNEDLKRVRMWQKRFPAILQAADLQEVHFDNETNLKDIELGNEELGFVTLVDVSWGNTNLTVINWASFKMLGEEREARQVKDQRKEVKDKDRRLNEFRIAVRASRQLTVILQGQGLNEESTHFAYRAQKLQRVVLRRQKKFGQYMFSGFLDLLAGYGYRPGRSVLWYLATILVFALAYHFLGGLTLYPPDAFVFSVMSFHGRGFFPALSQETNLHNPLVMLAALEAIIGLLIEISFIATFTQRFFGR